MVKPERRLSPEDQAKVDEFTHSGYNSTERKPFRPLLLLVILAAIVILLGQVAWWYAKGLGVV